MWHDDDFERKLTIGKVTLSVHLEHDDYPDLSWLGEYSNYREPYTENQKLVHRDSGLVLDHHGIWRDSKGHIQPTPEESRHSREYQYTWHDNGHDKLLYAIQDARRLEQYNDGDLCDFGVVVSIFYAGRKIGDDSLWGINSDSEESHVRQTIWEVAHQAIKSAKQFKEVITA